MNGDLNRDDERRFAFEEHDRDSLGKQPAADAGPEGEKPLSLARKLFEWVKVIVIAVVLGLLITTFIVQRNTVFGNSMLPTLLEKDELVVEKVSKWFGGVARGDIITVHMKGVNYGGKESNIIKRVIGVPGDRIELKDGGVYLNGEKLSEPYLADGTTTRILDRKFADVLLGDDEYFVMGDNRPESLDSRRFGPVARKDIIGEVLFRVWPLKRIGSP